MGKPAGTMEPARWLSGSAGDSKGVYITATNALVKFGPHVVPSREAATMRYVLQKCPEIPVPVVYASWTGNDDEDDIDDGGVGYIAMTPMPGKRLDEVWSTLDSKARESVMDDYRVILQRLRGLDPSPDTPVRIGAVDGGPAVDDRVGGGGRRCGGPFSTEAEFNGWLLSRLVHHPESVGKDHAGSFFVETLKSAMRENHKWRLTHGDMGPHNVLVDENDNVRITAVLGWGSAGWYPEYWEYVKMIQHMPRECWDFKSYARRLWSVGRVDVFYDVEYLVDQTLDSQVVHGG